MVKAILWLIFGGDEYRKTGLPRLLMGFLSLTMKLAFPSWLNAFSKCYGKSQHPLKAAGNP
jgi:hypothetical protein